MKLVSIDIGSTWTKGALFQLQDDELVLLARQACPTTVANLADGFFHLLEQLAGPTAARCGFFTLHRPRVVWP
jgi:hypothetical protein